MIRFDRSKHYTEIFSVNAGDNTRFIQDGVHFDATGEIVGDAVEITKAKKEEAVAKARAELAKREAELNAEAASLGLSTKAIDVDAIRAEVEAKVRAELAAAAGTVKVAPKPAFKKPGNQADDNAA